MAYDARCKILAAEFLIDFTNLTHSQRGNAQVQLAQHIQDAIESWLEDNIRPLTIDFKTRATGEKL